MNEVDTTQTVISTARRSVESAAYVMLAAYIVLAEQVKSLAAANRVVTFSYAETERKLETCNFKQNELIEIKSLELERIESISSEKERLIDTISGLESKLQRNQYTHDAELDKISNMREEESLGFKMQLDREIRRAEQIENDLGGKISKLEMQLRDQKLLKEEFKMTGLSRIAEEMMTLSLRNSKCAQTLPTNPSHVRDDLELQMAISNQTEIETIPPNNHTDDAIELIQDDYESIAKYESLPHSALQLSSTSPVADPYRSSPLTPEILRESQVMKSYLSPGYFLNDVINRRAFMNKHPLGL